MQNITFSSGSKFSPNASNNGTATGRMVGPVRLYDTAGDGKNAVLCLACPDNYETRDEQGRYVRHSQTITFRAFIPGRFAERLAFLEGLRRDDIVRVAYSVRTNNYVNSEGRRVYDQTLKMEDVVLVQPAAGNGPGTGVSGPDVSGPETGIPDDGDLPF